MVLEELDVFSEVMLPPAGHLQDPHQRLGRALGQGKSAVNQKSRGQIMSGFQISHYGPQVGAHLQ